MINKKIIFLVIVGIIFPLFLFSQSENINLRRMTPTEREEMVRLAQTDSLYTSLVEGRRVHPYQHYFDMRKQSYIPDTRSSNFNRLLAVMVEFQEDDNPNTTGNGKFLAEADPDFPISLGSPPYNREFFETQLEAMKYYYRAVSFETFQLEYEVYPKTKQAYVLPQEMAYYNPGMSHALFMERIEEYFRDVWTAVNEDEDGDRPSFFGEFGHFMIIHAGLSWQHASWATPNDMPSFFINVGDGKEVIVDGGQTKIKTSANVPERIWRERRPENSTIVYGYGVVNAVFAHEFGHSLGFADLYNTANGRPAVGMFDIMDSGGTESLMFEADDGYYYVVEGLFPALPSVWSRLIPFEQDYLDRGILVDMNSIPFGQTLQIMASSTRRSLGEGQIPYFYRIPLSETEYILIENRNLDPDGDGGSAIQGALNHRVALYPSPYYTSGASYEYDWLLPGWLGQPDSYGFRDTFGGGMMIWHIDDDIIYNQGEWIDGVFYSNYERNRVNLRNRGVRVIESDGLDDIGSPYSWFPTGTPFEYFFRYKPVLDGEGFFVRWSDEIHNMELSATSYPALKTNTGRPSSWKISNISSAGRIMTFEISNSMFEFTANLGTFSELHAVSNVADFTGQISILSEDGLQIYTPDDSPASWKPLYTVAEINTKPDFEIQNIYIDTEYRTGFLMVYGDRLVILDGENFYETEIGKVIIEAPINFLIDEDSFLGLVFEDSSAVYRIDKMGPDNIRVEHVYTIDSKVKFLPHVWGGCLSILHTNVIYDMCPSQRHDHDPMLPIELPENFTIFEPAFYSQRDRAILYLLSDSYKLYAVEYKASGDHVVKQIFDLKNYTSEIPSNLALGYAVSNRMNFVLLYTETMVFVLSEDGSFYQNFPQILRNNRLDINSNPYIFEIDDEIFFMLPDKDQGLLGMGLNGVSMPNKSLYWNQGYINPQFFVDRSESALNLIYADMGNTVFSAAMKIEEKDKIMWNGFRNGYWGHLVRTEAFVPSPDSNRVEVFVYPNPVRQDVASLRINNTSSPAFIRIFSISGQMVLSYRMEESIEDFKDFRFSTERFSSGMYFVVVEINGRTYQDKFSIIK